MYRLRLYLFVFCVSILLMFNWYWVKPSMKQLRNEIKPINEKHNLKCLNFYEYYRPTPSHKWTSVLNDAIIIFKENNYQFSLASGTLLHMYRDCGLASDTGDIDISVPLETLDENMIKSFLDKGWIKKMTFGTIGEPGFEVALIHPNGNKMDLYGETNEGDFTWLAVWVNRRAYMCAYENPTQWFTLHVDDLTSYPVHGEPEKFFEGVYGTNWRNPIPTKNYNWINPRCKKSKYKF